MKPAVSVVIPAYNSASTIAEAVEACLNQDHPDVEVIVVDDGSVDDTRCLAQHYPVRCISQKNMGPAGARNRGWRVASGEIICFTDSDCVPSRDWVTNLVMGYTSEEIAGVGGTYQIANASNLLAACIHEEIVQRHLKMPKFVNYLGSFNLSYRRAVLEQVDGFDESYRRASGEDNDLAYRVMKRGYRLAFTRDARVAHYHPDNLWRYLRQQFWHGFWRMRIYHDHPDMAGGDAYGGLADFIQPPLALTTLCLLPLTWLPVVGFVMLTLLAVIFIVQLPTPLAISRRTRHVKYLALAPVTLLRAYARGMGMLLGVVKFFVLAS